MNSSSVFLSKTLSLILKQLFHTERECGNYLYLTIKQVSGTIFSVQSICTFTCIRQLYQQETALIL